MFVLLMIGRESLVFIEFVFGKVYFIELKKSYKWKGHSILWFYNAFALKNKEREFQKYSFKCLFKFWRM